MVRKLIAGFVGAVASLLLLIILVINDATMGDIARRDNTQAPGQASGEIVTIQAQAVPAAAVPQETLQKEMLEEIVPDLSREDLVVELPVEKKREKAPAAENKQQEISDKETKQGDVPAQEEKAEESPIQNLDTGSLVEDVVARVNRVRTEKGLCTLTTTPEVMNAASIRAGEIQQSFSHQRPDGSDSVTALNAAGAAYGYAGENLFYGFATAADVERAWSNSSIHRDNVLCANYRHIGVGYVNTSNGIYLAQVFTD